MIPEAYNNYTSIHLWHSIIKYFFFLTKAEIENKLYLFYFIMNMT